MHDSARLVELSPPSWALDAISGASESSISDDPHAIRVRSAERHALLSTVIAGAHRLTTRELERAVHRRYLELLERADRLPTRHLLRIWNQIPGILEPLDPLPHRYLAFNAGRFHAYREWYGERFSEYAPTASGVGAPGADLMIHALASTVPCRPLQNPRQRPSHLYSEAYGPCPPCFARAVLEADPGGDRRLIVGGTASVCGERTVHPGDLPSQMEETLLNLAMLVEVATRPEPAGALAAPAIDERLRAFRSLRVYHVAADDRGEISAAIQRRFPSLEAVEYVRTELCRDDLLIEIEGVAELDPTT